MTLIIYLEKRVIDVLNCYGRLNDVVNRILEEGAVGNIDVMDKPTCPPKQNGQHYSIDVTEENYLGLYNTWGPKSSRISLRRLLYWFVDNEIYNELGWEGVETFKSSEYDKSIKLIGDIKMLLFRLEKECCCCHEQISVIRENLNEMERTIWDA